jgi:hypothetical protein
MTRLRRTSGAGGRPLSVYWKIARNGIDSMVAAAEGAGPWAAYVVSCCTQSTMAFDSRRKRIPDEMQNRPFSQAGQLHELVHFWSCILYQNVILTRARIGSKESPHRKRAEDVSGAKHSPSTSKLICDGQCGPKCECDADSDTYSLSPQTKNRRGF